MREAWLSRSSDNDRSPSLLLWSVGRGKGGTSQIRPELFSVTPPLSSPGGQGTAWQVGSFWRIQRYECDRGIWVRPIRVLGLLAAHDGRELALPLTQKTVRTQDAQENPDCFPQLHPPESFAMLGPKGYSKGCHPSHPQTRILNC